MTVVTILLRAVSYTHLDVYKRQVFSFWKHFANGLQHTQALVPNNEFDPIQTAAAQLLEEADPAGLVLFHALGCTQNLPVSILIDRNRHQNSHILKPSAPVAAQIDPVHIDIRVTPTLQRTISLILDVDICFLVQFTEDVYKRQGWNRGNSC